MRVRPAAIKHARRPRLRVAYHASNNARHTLQANDVSNRLVSQASPYSRSEHGSQTRGSRSEVLKNFLEYYLPFDNFSSSLYSVPMLLLFRLFYPAAPYAIRYALQGVQSKMVEVPTKGPNRVGNGHDSKKSAPDFLNTYAKLDVNTFSTIVNACPELADAYRIRTLTWVKALASPLSHEYIQIVIEHRHTGQRYRLVTERSDMGDAVLVGWDWSSQEYASHHHVLPLPLLSLLFETGAGPSLSRLSAIMTETSRVQEYNLLREMCWWYAERVFTQVTTTSPSVTVKHWPFARLRYSFVVQNEWIKRQRLIKEAEMFRTATRTEMLY